MEGLQYGVFPFSVLPQHEASLTLLVGACVCALFSDMNTESAVLSIGFPLLGLGAICGYDSNKHRYGNLYLFGVYFLPACFCRSLGAMDYFHVPGRISKVKAYFITFAIMLPLMAFLGMATLVQKKLWLQESPSSILSHTSFLAFPSLVCGIFQLLFRFSPIGAAGNPAMGFALITSPPLEQLVSAVGEIGLVFAVCVLSSFGAGFMVGKLTRKHFTIIAVLWAFVQIVGGWRLAAGMGLWETPIGHWPLSKAPNFQVSCLCSGHAHDVAGNGTEIFIDTNTTSDMINRVNSRLAAGDDLIILSEAAVFQRVTPDMLHWPADNPGAVVAIAFMERLDENSTKWHNSVELLQAGESLMRYDKNRPVPIIEAAVVAGKEPPTPMSINFTPLARDLSKRTKVELNVATAICFDFDFPNVIRHAHRADLVIGPSNYWASLGRNLWSDNVHRAVETGFTLFKCASNGVSGASDPYGRILAARPTLAGDTFHAQIPIQPSVSTIYADYGGFCFGWFCVVISPLWILLALFWPLPISVSVTEDGISSDHIDTDVHVSLQEPLLPEGEANLPGEE